jgi:hypothetical protein
MAGCPPHPSGKLMPQHQGKGKPEVKSDNFCQNLFDPLRESWSKAASRLKLSEITRTGALG